MLRFAQWISCKDSICACSTCLSCFGRNWLHNPLCTECNRIPREWSSFVCVGGVLSNACRHHQVQFNLGLRVFLWGRSLSSTGGYGTLEELVGVITWNQLRIHRKNRSCALLDVVLVNFVCTCFTRVSIHLKDKSSLKHFLRLSLRQKRAECCGHSRILDIFQVGVHADWFTPPSMFLKIWSAFMDIRVVNCRYYLRIWSMRKS